MLRAERLTKDGRSRPKVTRGANGWCSEFPGSPRDWLGVEGVPRLCPGTLGP